MMTVLVPIMNGNIAKPCSDEYVGFLYKNSLPIKARSISMGSGMSVCI